MNEKEFVKKSKKYRNELNKFIRLNFGKRCGHIGKDEISLDCANCKSWLVYDFFSWFIDHIDDIEKWNFRHSCQGGDDEVVCDYII